MSITLKRKTREPVIKAMVFEEINDELKEFLKDSRGSVSTIHSTKNGVDLAYLDYVEEEDNEIDGVFGEIKFSSQYTTRKLLNRGDYVVIEDEYVYAMSPEQYTQRFEEVV